MTEPTNEPDGINAASRFVVTVDKPGPDGELYRIESPDRVMRMWAVLSAGDDSLREPVLTAGMRDRLRQSLQAARAELKRSVSAPLAAEMEELLGPAGSSDASELRVEYAGLLGWTGGLVVHMLGEVEAAAAASARQVRRDGVDGGHAGGPQARQPR